MIREGKKLPKDVLKKIPKLVDKISSLKDVVALFFFGSGSKGELKPLSD
jgi:hypothetical protein